MKTTKKSSKSSGYTRLGTARLCILFWKTGSVGSEVSCCFWSDTSPWRFECRVSVSDSGGLLLFGLSSSYCQRVSRSRADRECVGLISVGQLGGSTSSSHITPPEYQVPHVAAKYIFMFHVPYPCPDPYPDPCPCPCPHSHSHVQPRVGYSGTE